jgi:hypothetical protein
VHLRFFFQYIFSSVLTIRIISWFLNVENRNENSDKDGRKKSEHGGVGEVFVVEFDAD